MINIVLFGAPGSGKGTQAEKLAAKYGIGHLSTGDVIREEIKGETPLGREVKEYIAQGLLAPDELVNRIIQSHIASHREAKGNIYDGFPRTIAQAEAFGQMLTEHGQDVTLMVSLEVPDEELVARILNRAKVSGRADDANLDVIKNRIRVYKEQTAVVADYYNGQGKYFPIHGLGTVDEVFDRIVEVVDQQIAPNGEKINADKKH